MPLPIPRSLKDCQHDYHDMHHDNCGCDNHDSLDGLPFPLPCPSDEWLIARKNIIYDTTENWMRSEMRLRLGTIAVSYDLDSSCSCFPPKVVSYAIKVAFKDRFGNPQVWRDLPFVSPNLSPYIQTIVEQLSGVISANFVTKQEFAETKQEFVN